MKYLIIDDMPEHLKLPVRTLRKIGHQVTTARDLDVGWQLIRDEHKEPFNLVILDLVLDTRSREFAWEQSIIRGALSPLGYGDLPTSGQAMGLRLWRRRKELQQRYCYLTNIPRLWIPKLDERRSGIR